MRRAFHVPAALAGALACSVVAAAWCAVAPQTYEAAAIAGFEGAAAGRAALDPAAARALVSTRPVLRRAALRPEAAGAIDLAARPRLIDRLANLVASSPADQDTLSRAVAFLGRAVDAGPGPWPGTISVIARMAAPADAAHVATAVAEAFVADFNETATRLNRRLDRDRRARLVAAERRRVAARERLAALRAADATPVAAIPAPAAGSTADAGLAGLEHAAARADASLKEAERIYGPRHPSLIRIETDARRARQALAAARAAMERAAARRSQSLHEGGPDPRAADIAAAEKELAGAEAAYDLAEARGGATQREARIVRAAPIPAAAGRPSAPALIAGSALFGFLLAGAAPALGGRSAPRGARRRTNPPLARLRRGQLDAAGRRRVIGALRIADSRGALRTLVLGDAGGAAESGARALAHAALEAGWRPLLVVPANEADAPPATPDACVSIDGAWFDVTTVATAAGPLSIARSSRPRALRRLAPDIAFDLVVFCAASRLDHPDAIIHVGCAGPDAALERWRGAPALFVGSIAPDRRS